MNDNPHIQLVREMEGNLVKHGDSYLGVGWTKKKENADVRYKVMLELMEGREPSTLLDFGCGAAHLYEYMVAQGIDWVRYSGLDLSPKYLNLCRTKHPHLTFYGDDVLDPSARVPMHDYVVMNGVFNYKGDFSFDEMWSYCQRLLIKVSSLAAKGFAFNVVSKHVDWERDDLFHLPFDLLAEFLYKNVSRQFTFRHDYGLFEYTTYVCLDSR
jgi:SAM-dependent methyltransferase